MIGVRAFHAGGIQGSYNIVISGAGSNCVVCIREDGEGRRQGDKAGTGGGAAVDDIAGNASTCAGVPAECHGVLNGWGRG